MGRKIQNREGLFKTIRRQREEKAYERRKKELDEENVNVDRKDIFALLLSSFLVIVLPCLLILGFIVFISFLVFGLI